MGKVRKRTNKRQTLKKKYSIQKNIKESKRKIKKEARKLKKKGILYKSKFNSKFIQICCIMSENDTTNYQNISIKFVN